jgi:hypothetical protein
MDSGVRAGERGISVRDPNALFEQSSTHVGLRQLTYLRRHLLDFIRSVAPTLTLAVVVRLCRTVRRKTEGAL